MVGGSARRPRPQLPQMRISLPRHDLLGEETWPVSQRRRARSLFLKYRAYVCVYIYVCVCVYRYTVELINHCQAVMIKR